MYLWANQRGTADVVGIPRDMFEGIALLALPPLLLFTVSNWRCPSCNEYRPRIQSTRVSPDAAFLSDNEARHVTTAHPTFDGTALGRPRGNGRRAAGRSDNAKVAPRCCRFLPMELGAWQELVASDPDAAGLFRTLQRNADEAFPQTPNPPNNC